MPEHHESHIGHYRIVSLLGQGGMGLVYRAHDDRLDRDVAVKLLTCETRDDPTARARLLREARTASQLNHPHIAHVYEVNDDGERIFVVFELIEGKTLEKSIPQGGYAPERLLRIALEIARALDYAHERGVVHRDLKSANIMLNDEGMVKVLDFGLARRTGDEVAEAAVPLPDPNLTMTGTVVGTPNHLPPEVLRGEKADTRSDIWAFGVVLYEMASGTFPFKGTNMLELATAIAGDSPRPLSGRIPVGLQAVIARCLEKEPARRYHNGGEVRAALEALLGVAERRRTRRESRRPWIAAATVAIALASAWAAFGPGPFPWRRGPQPPPGSIAPRAAYNSLAVLPLTNLSGDPAQEYFADGMTEELITNLAPIPTLKVISRTSVMRYKGSKEKLTDIARALGVDLIVEGSVQRVGNRVRITAQLIEASTDRHLWAKSFDREFHEVLTLQTEVARDIAQAVELELTPAMNARLAAARPVNPRVYDLVLKGRYEWSKLTPASVAKSIDFYQRALALDPDDPRAASGLADAYLIQTQVLGSLPQRQGMAKVKEYAGRALAADPQSAEAHASNALALLFGDWDFTGAESEAKKAVDLNPGYSGGHIVYSVVLATQSRIAEALEHDRRALELDPMSLLITWNAVNTLRQAHRYDEALALARKGLRIDPNAHFLHAAMMRIHELKEDYEAALDVLEKYSPLYGPNHPSGKGKGSGMRVAEIRRAYEREGPAGYWRAALADAEKMEEHSPEVCVTLAYMNTMLGDKAKALDYLEKSYQAHIPDLLFIRSEPAFAVLRDEPRYQELLRRVGFPDVVNARTSRSPPEPPRRGAGEPSRG